MPGLRREFQKNDRLATHTALGELFIPDEFGKCKGEFWSGVLGLRLSASREESFNCPFARGGLPDESGRCKREFVDKLARDHPRHPFPQGFDRFAPTHGRGALRLKLLCDASDD